ncbi:hypothetical protein [Dactylosporangium sp. NPDC050588]|uniref:hypothetical protein n=1 Tax=Dactylosporangium sp. NPDC050588 TaxID=3157211 RepID=UPI003406F94F
MRPIAADHSAGLLARLVSLGAPAGDLLLMSMLLRLVTSPGGRSASYRFLIGAFGLTLGTDVLYSVVNTIAVYAGGAMDAGWMAAYVLFGAASAPATPWPATAARSSACSSSAPPRRRRHGSWTGCAR